MFPFQNCGWSHARCWSRTAGPAQPPGADGVSFFGRAAIGDRFRPDLLARAIEGSNAFGPWLRRAWRDFAISASGGRRR
jgi:hypothetical protein